MICAILSADNLPFFSIVYDDLRTAASQSQHTDIADAESNLLPQVHALNCLKDIITNSRFRTCTERHLTELLEISSRCLISEVWPIRNSGLMLLRACMHRLSSSHATQPVPSTSTREQPIDVAIRLLQHEQADSSDVSHEPEAVFAGLDLAMHVASASKNPERLEHYISRHLSSPVWTVREHAAKLLGARIATTTRAEDRRSYPKLSQLTPEKDCSQNEIHGYLMLLRYVFDEFSDQSDRRSCEAVARVAFEIGVEIAKGERRSSPYVEVAVLKVTNRVLLYFLRRSHKGKGFLAVGSNSMKLLKMDSDDPAYTVFRREKLLSEITAHFARDNYASDKDDSHSLPRDAAIQEIVRDRDAALYVVETIHSFLRDEISTVEAILVKVASYTTDVEVKAAAMLASAKVLEFPEDRPLETQCLDLFRGSIKADSHLERDYFLAFTRLEGCLLHHDLLVQRPQESENIKARLCGLLSMLKVAAADELEVDTRENAAITLQGFCLRRADMIVQPAFRENYGFATVALDIFLLVYDQLNDDDDIIGNRATQTALALIQKWEPDSQNGDERDKKYPERLCRVASRQKMFDLMFAKFPESPQLFEVALQRLVIGSRCRLPLGRSSIPDLFRLSVQQRLDQIKDSMSELFVEEKQNLYLDEYEEIQTWGKHLSSLWVKSNSRAVLDYALPWCVAGFKLVLDLLKEEKDKRTAQGVMFHPLGSSYHPDVLVLMLRVIKLEHVIGQLNGLLVNEQNAEGDVIEGVDQLRKLRTELRDPGFWVDSKIHPRVREAADR
jgi:hypothetical protein